MNTSAPTDSALDAFWLIPPISPTRSVLGDRAGDRDAAARRSSHPA